MTRPFHLIQALVLSALLALTGQALAHARGGPLAVGLMQLCTGSGPVMVQVDADGQPVDAPHYCPEGALSLLQAVALPPMPEPVGSWIRAPENAPADWTAPSLHLLSGKARGPPAGTHPVA